MATLDILGLDPTAPQVPQPQQQQAQQQPVAKPASATAAPRRVPAATAQPVNAAAAAASSSSSSSSSSRPHRSGSDLSEPLESLRVSAPPAGATLHTPSGVAYTAPSSAPLASSFNRGRWTSAQLALRAAEFTETRELLLFAGSWNVNGKKPREEADLAPWLLHRIRCKGEKKGAGAADDDDADDDDVAEESGTAEKDRRFRAPDIYVVGFQEIVDLNAGNLLVDHNASEAWEARILATLARTGKVYCRITTTHLVGLSLAVFVREKHRHAVSDVRVDEVGVGIMGVGGNKGAVLIKLRLYKTVFCFINTHLAAHQNAVKARNADFWNIVRRASFEGPRKARVCSDLAGGEWIEPEEARRLAQGGGSSAAGGLDNLAASASSLFDSGMSKFKVMMDNVAQKKAASATGGNGGNGGGGGGAGGAGSSSSAADSDEPAHLATEVAQNDHITSMEELRSLRDNPHGLFGAGSTNHIVWLGDNNYRLNVVELGMAATHALIQRGAWDELLGYDQLLAEKAARRVFLGFTEPKISFPPTYKFVTGTSSYDRREDKKVRFPAYTDRIQFMTCRPPTSRGHHHAQAGGGGGSASLQALQVAAATGGAHLVLNALHPLYYASTWALTASDHKPVMQLLEAPVIAERERSKRKLLEKLELLSDEECAPRIAVSAAQLEFGTVPFDFAVTRSFQIRNVGDAVSAFRIVAGSGGGAGAVTGVAALTAPAGQPHQAHGHGHGHGHRGGLGGHDAVLTKPWLRVTPSSGVLALGATLTVHVTMHVTSRSGAAHQLTSEADALAGALLLRLDGGYLYRVSLAAAYEKGICGTELSYLNALPCRSIRDADPAEVVSNDSAYSVPQALFRLVDYMSTKKGVLTLKQGAFVPPAYVDEQSDSDESEGEQEDNAAAGAGEDARAHAAARRRARRAGRAPRSDVPQQVCTAPMRWILDYLDTGRSLDKDPRSAGKWKSPAAPAPTEPPGDLPASAFVHTLLYFLASLPQPLLVASASQRWATGMDLTAWCYATMLETDVDRYRTLVYVLAFAREVVANHRLNGCNVDAWSSALGVALCHRAPSAPMSPLMPITCTNLVKHLLTSADFAKLPADNAEHQQALQMAHAQPVAHQVAPRGRYNDIQ